MVWQNVCAYVCVCMLDFWSEHVQTHTDGPWQPTNKCIHFKIKHIKMKMHILLCNKWLILKIKFIIHSLCIVSNVFSVNAPHRIFYISMGVCLQQHLDKSNEILLNCERRRRQPNSERTNGKKTDTHTKAHKSNEIRGIHKCLAYFPRFRQSVHGWRL